MPVASLFPEGSSQFVDYHVNESQDMENNMKPNAGWLKDIQQTADYVGVSPRTIARWLHQMRR